MASRRVRRDDTARPKVKPAAHLHVNKSDLKNTHGSLHTHSAISNVEFSQRSTVCLSANAETESDRRHF